MLPILKKLPVSSFKYFLALAGMLVAGAAAANDGNLQNESTVDALEIKVGYDESGGKGLTFYSRGEVLDYGYNITEPVVNLEAFYNFTVPGRNTQFQINACETVYDEVNNDPPQYFSQASFQMGRGTHPNIFWTDIPNDGHPLGTLLPIGCMQELDFQRVKDYQAGFSTRAKQESALDHFVDIHIRTKFAFAANRRSGTGLVVTAYSPAFNLNIPAKGTAAIFSNSGRNFNDETASFYLDDSRISDQNGTQSNHHSYAWIIGYLDENGRKYSFNQCSGR